MEGEVYIPYTPIGGRNMSNGMMTLDLVGSTYPPESSVPGMINVKWVYPGGIILKTDAGEGLWGYMLSAYSEGGSIAHDSDVTKYLEEHGINGEAEQQAEINTLVRTYVTRVMAYEPPEGLEDQYGYIAFQRTFRGCWSVVQ